MTATSADGCCTKWRFVAVVGPYRGLGGFAEGVAEEVDDVALEAESDVGVDDGGYADVSVAEKLLDHNEFDALFQEEGGRRVPEGVERMRRSVARRSRVLTCRVRVAPSMGEPSGRVKT